MNDTDVTLAKVGLIALIDEATGYQSVRGPTELRGQAERLGLGALWAVFEARLDELGLLKAFGGERQ